MILDTVSRSAQVVLGEATVTTACDIVASYAKVTSDSFVTACALATSAGVTPVTVVPHPPYGAQYQINELRVHNNDTVSHRISVRLLDTAAARIVQSSVVPAGGDFLYTPTATAAAAANAFAAGQLPGTATNDNAAAGNVGEFISANVPIGSAVPLTNLTAANVTSIVLTAGDWDVFGNVGYVLGGTTLMTVALAWTTLVSATQPTFPNAGGGTSWTGNAPAGLGPLVSAGLQRLSLAATTTVYLGTSTAFSTSTAAAYGFFRARRVR